jgi:hypothetical protein
LRCSQGFQKRLDVVSEGELENTGLIGLVIRGLGGIESHQEGKYDWHDWQLPPGFSNYIHTGVYMHTNACTHTNTYMVTLCRISCLIDNVQEMLE